MSISDEDVAHYATRNLSKVSVFDEGAPFFADTSLIKGNWCGLCKLCGSRLYLDLVRHCRDDSHTSRAREIRRFQEKCIKDYLQLKRLKLEGKDWDAKIQERVSFIPWQEEIRSKLYPYLTLELDNIPDKLPNFNSMIEEKFALERLALLEHATWKIVTIMTFSDDNHDVLQVLNFVRDGWKEHKEKTFRSNSVVIIVRRVREFLPKAEETNSHCVGP